MTVTVSGGITFSGGGLTFAPSGAPSVTPTVEYLVVAGGGGGGRYYSGGGGAGGFRTASGFAVASGTPIAVTVGRELQAEIIANGRPSPAKLLNAMSNPESLQSLQLVQNHNRKLP
jgi:hypothetical protein